MADEVAQVAWILVAGVLAEPESQQFTRSENEMSRLAWLVLIAASATITGCGGDSAPPADGTEPVSVSTPEVPEPAEPSSELLPADATPELTGSDLP